MGERRALIERQLATLTDVELERVELMPVCSMECARAQSDDETGFFEPPCDCGAVPTAKKLDAMRRAGS